jgi:integrase
MFVFSGLRLGEALALRWEDVDLAAGTIHIRAAKTLASVRAVNLLPVLRSELRVYKTSLSDPRDALLFAARNGQPLNASNVRQRILALAIQRANIRLHQRGIPPLPTGLTPHSLRRTFASLLFALGESPTYVMSQMGHTTPALTLALYARAMNRRDGEDKRLRALVDGSSGARKPLRGRTSTTRTTSSTTTTLRAPLLDWSR